MQRTRQEMAIFAYLIGDAPVKIWGLSSTERFRRQFQQVKGVTQIDDLKELPGDALDVVDGEGFEESVVVVDGLDVAGETHVPGYGSTDSVGDTVRAKL